MSIAEKLIQLKTDLDAVYNSCMSKGYNAGYEAGKAAGGGVDPLQYATTVARLFLQADFGGQDEIKVNMPNCPANIQEMFGRTLGFRKLTAYFTTTKAHDAYRFIYGHSTGTSEIEELEILDGMKFSRIDGFAQYCVKLKTITGRLDLSQCTNTASSFLNCSVLETVGFVPNSIPLSISFAQSPKLSDASIASIINGLSLEASGQTLTVHPTVAAKITETDVTDRGWALVY